MALNKWCQAALLITGIALAGCGGPIIPPMDDPDTFEPGQAKRGYYNDPGRFFGGDGVDLSGILGLSENDRSSSKGVGIGVNTYLWRASLDTMAFMPLSSADPFGGVIITDWYTPPETPRERFKINIYILGRQLRADGVRVAVFRQNRDGSQWIDASVEKKTSVKLENKILVRARQLRVAARSAGN